MRALWILALCCAAAAVAMFAAFAFVIPPPDGATPRDIQALSLVRDTRADIRSIADGLEAFADINRQWPSAKVAGAPPPGFAATVAMLADPDGNDPLRAPFRARMPIACHFEESGFLLVAPGPDGDFDIDAPREVFASIHARNHAAFAGGPLVYDPTNGIVSNGDIWSARD